MRRRFYEGVEPQVAACGPHIHHMHHGRGPWGGEFGGRGFGPGGPRGGGGGRRKRSRGDIRAAILTLLAETPMHGYQIIGEIAERSDDAWRPSAGSVYPTLQQLTDEGLVRSEESDGRRVYELTDTGRAEAGSREGPAPWEQAADEDGNPHRELRRLLGGLIQAVGQVAQAGNPEQLGSAQEILREARKRIYRLLADEE
jgi:DNA-binding PadR family transcriptional regulator